MSATRIKVKRSDVTKRLFAKIRLVQDMSGFANRVLYRLYQQKQIKRWDTENESEGDNWKRLNPDYEAYKRRRYAKYPYSGKRIGVATGRLLKSVVGPHEDHKKVRMGQGFLVLTSVPYAQRFDQTRSITGFGKETVEEFRSAVREYLQQ